MKIIDDIFLEVVQIRIFTNQFMNIRVVEFLETTIFLVDIKDISKYKYLHDSTIITMKDGSWLKVRGDYKKLRNIWAEWYKVDEETKEIETK